MLLYAETHYPGWMPSIVRRREPEIVADVPWRVEPGMPIPVLLLIADADSYPVHIDALTLSADRTDDGPDGGPAYRREVPIGESVATGWWWRMFEIPPRARPGAYSVTVTIRYRLENVGSRRRQSRIAVTDNYRGTSHRPFSVRVAAERWPLPEGSFAGDAHVHTAYTRDQVEFGPPIEAISAMSRAMGVSWATLTDHSYDLDDSEASYMASDDSLPRWRGMLSDAQVCGGSGRRTCLIPGEEISCGNSRGRNVHLLGLGMTEYVPGSGDSAERPLHTRPDLPAGEAARLVRAQGGAVFAAHPGHIPPLGERIVFRRGAWTSSDFSEDGDARIDGMQFWNGETDAGFRRGRRLWIASLLAGREVVALAGNDSHGSFGRFRQVRLPWLSLTDDTRHLYAKARTVVRAESLSEQSVLAAIVAGRSYLTDGPELTLEVRSDSDAAAPGETCVASSGERVVAVAKVRSTAEWGRIERIDLYYGVFGESEERCRSEQIATGHFEAERGARFEAAGPGYIRAEAVTRTGSMALTNPVRIA